MGQRAGFLTWAQALGSRLSTRFAQGAGGPKDILRAPEPGLRGDPSLGRRLLAGQARLGEAVIDAPGRSIWTWGNLAAPPDAAAAERLHAFAWLDDLAALGTPAARRLAALWVDEWIVRHGREAGPGWEPGIAANRLLAWVLHSRFLTLGRDAAAVGRLARSMRRQALMLRRRARRCPDGLARLTTHAALVRAGLALPGLAALAPPAATALGEAALRAVDAEGATPSRNPEELLDILVLLTETAQAMGEAGLVPAAGHVQTIARIKPVLRALRHADGGLARFHGGGFGAEGRLDQALAASGRAPGFRTAAHAGGRAPLHMGYARMAAGRTTIVVDAAAPPQGPGTVGHASTLAFEMTIGRRPLIVSCGPGEGFGRAWSREVRSTASHSTLVLDGLSSSRLASVGAGGLAPRLTEGPGRVIAESTPLAEGLRYEFAHDGWRASHGLTHARILDLSPDGSRLSGEDVLTTLTAADRPLFDAALDAGRLLGVAFAVRFHLHPDVEVEIGAVGTATFGLRSGEAWTLSLEGDAALSLAPSTYLEAGWLEPRASSQVVLSGRASSYATRLRWTIAKAGGTTPGRRDLAPSAAALDDPALGARAFGDWAPDDEDEDR